METADWQASNTRALAAAVGWVRTRLENAVASIPGPVMAPVEPPPTPPASRPFWRRAPRAQPAAVPAVRTSGDALVLHAGGTDLAGALAQVAAAPSDADAGPPPMLVLLCQRLGLTRFEQEVLLLCAAMELDTSIARLCARAQGEPMRPYPTFALALSLFDDPAWEVLSPERPMRYWRLIEINQPGGEPLTTSQLRIDERIVNYLKGLTYLDDRLVPLLSPLSPPEASEDTPASQRSVAQNIVDHLQPLLMEPTLPVVQLLGSDPASKRLVAGLVSDALGRRAYRLHWSVLPSAASDLETLARLWQRESLLLPIGLYLETQGLDGDESQQAQVNAVNRLLMRLRGLVFVDTLQVWSGLSQPTLTADVAKPTPEEQEAAWRTILGDSSADSPTELAGQFNLNLESIREIAQPVLFGPASNDTSVHTRLWDACLAATRPRLGTLAQRIEPKATWDDIVLPQSEADLLRQIADQVGQRSTVYRGWGFAERMSRGLGISALFAGDSGTGKTMAAEVISDQLRLNLYRIDLSAVVSKYIGETEKNLRRLFDAAEDGGAILFFDEADALFGKRSEVKDSHDRYANIEINYLLQRMESYAGLAILATNMKSALDPAFLRRLRFVVNFPFPGVTERKLMWQKVFPPSTPTWGLDFDWLARLNLTGGYISIVALNAAFMAAHAGEAVTMPIVLEAARNEFRKLERPIHEPNFRWPLSTPRVA